jgi:RND family efflux transporter MFP subunit
MLFRISCVALAILTSSILLVFSCSKSTPEPETVLRPVRAQQVFSSGGNRVRKFAGVARSGMESKISFKVGGTIERLVVDVGNRVERGQLLAELDPEDYRLQVQDGEASLVQAEAEERNASASYERVRGLYENRNASKQDLDAARATHESAAAGVESAKKRLELSRRKLSYCRLTAPLDAAVAEVPVEVNENVNAGQTIVLLTSGANIEVEVAIPGVLIARIREGDPVTVYFDALSGRVLTARVTEVGVAATGTATTFPVRVRLDAADADVRSGMAAEVGFSFASPGESERYYVPSVAVCEDREARYVFVVEPSGDYGVGVVRRKDVTIGELTDLGLEIRDGLSDGDFVITAGVSKLIDRQKVRFEGAVEP